MYPTAEYKAMLKKVMDSLVISHQEGRNRYFPLTQPMEDDDRGLFESRPSE